MNIKHLYPAPVDSAKVLSSKDLQEPAPTQAQLRARLRAALNVAADPMAMAQIAVRLVEEAKLGNLSAIKMLCELLQGRPEVEGADNAKQPMLTPNEVEKALKDMGWVRK